MNEIPEHVIRFYGNTDYALECIALKQITFLHVDKLNDPFDPVLDYITDFNNNYSALLSHVRKYHPSQFEPFKKRLPKQAWKKTVAGWSNLASSLRSSMFVFSTCAVREGNHPRDNLYMWSHYGNGHRGVAIEFNTAVLTDLFEKQDDPNVKSPWWKMEYVKEIPKIDCEAIFEFVINAREKDDDLLTIGSMLYSIIAYRVSSKGKVWRSEDEWRLVSRINNTKLKIYRYNIPKEAITAVYLGCRAAEQEQLRNDFVYETQHHNPNANIFCARK